MKKIILAFILLFIFNCSLTVIKARKYNFIFSTKDIITTAENDFESYSEIIINNNITNRTPNSPLSEEQKIRLKLPANNNLIKIIKYVKDPTDQTFKPLNKKYQPKEQFVYTYKKKITFFKIQYSENSCRYSISIEISSNKRYKDL